jgi:hypothetical protein
LFQEQAAHCDWCRGVALLGSMLCTMNQPENLCVKCLLVILTEVEEAAAVSIYFNFISLWDYIDFVKF